jgi:hypothetical protein
MSYLCLKTLCPTNASADGVDRLITSLINEIHRSEPLYFRYGPDDTYENFALLSGTGEPSWSNPQTSAANFLIARVNHDKTDIDAIKDGFAVIKSRVAESETVILVAEADCCPSNLDEIVADILQSSGAVSRALGEDALDAYIATTGHGIISPDNLDACLNGDLDCGTPADVVVEHASSHRDQISWIVGSA